MDVSGTARVTKDVSLNGLVRMTKVENSTSTGTGTLVVSGGVGIGGNLNVGETANITGKTTLSRVEINSLLTHNLTQMEPIAYISRTANNISSDTRAYLDFHRVGGTKFTMGFLNGSIDVSNTFGFFPHFSYYTSIDNADLSKPGMYPPALCFSMLNNYVGINRRDPTYNLDVSGTARVSGDTSLNGLVRMTKVEDSSSATTGTLVVSGGVGISENLNVGGYARINNSLYFTSSTSENSIRFIGTGVTGDLSYNANKNHVFNNSIGIGIYPAFNLDVSGTARVTKDVSLNGLVRMTKVQTSGNTTEGTLVVSGGVGISENLNVGGTLIAGHTTLPSARINGNQDAVSSSHFVITCPTADLLNPKAHINFERVGPPGNTGGSNQFTMAYLNGTDVSSTFGFFAQYDYFLGEGTGGPYGRVNPLMCFTPTRRVGINRKDALYNLDVSGTARVTKDVSLNGLVRMTNVEDSSSATTGTLVVSGGVGIAGNVNIGQFLNTTNDINTQNCTVRNILYFDNTAIIGTGNSTIQREYLNSVLRIVGCNVYNAGSTDTSRCVYINDHLGIRSTLSIGAGTINYISPYNLDVNGTTRVYGQLTIEETGGGSNPSTTPIAALVLKHTTAGHSSITFPSVYDSGNTYGFIKYADSYPSGISRTLFIGLNTVSLDRTPDKILLLTTSNTGYIGINRTDPSYNFDVDGTARITSKLYIGTGSDNAVRNRIFLHTYGLEIVGSGGSDNFDATDRIIGLWDKVGIKTTNPIYNLDVTGNARITTSLMIGTTDVMGKFDNYYTQSQSNSNYYGVKTNVTINNNEIITKNLLARDYLEIGNDGGSHLTSLHITRPENYYSLKSHINFHREGYNMFSMGYLGGSVDISNTFGFFNNYTYHIPGSQNGGNTPVMCFKGQNVGINRKNPTYNLDVDGTVNGTSFNAGSDYRIKENVVELKNTNYTVNQLRPVHYYNKKSKKKDIGFIAHELQETYPFLVTGEKDGEDMQSVNYTGLIGVLVKETQTLKEETQTLKEETQILKEETQTLKEETQTLKEETKTLKEETQTLKEETKTLKEEKKNQDMIISALIKRIEKLEQ